MIDQLQPPAQNLSPEAKLRVMRELAERELCRRRLMPFIKRMQPDYLDGWFHQDLARRMERFLQDVRDGKNPHLLIMAPPRHGKTEIAGRKFISWALGKHPDMEVISAAYNVGLSGEFSREVKGIIETEEYAQIFPGTRPDKNNWSNETWGLTNEEGKRLRGKYLAAGIRGGITGKGADILYIDDAIKNAEEAESKQGLEDLWTWFTSVAYTRLSPTGGVIIVQTPWADGDLMGRIQREMVENPDFPRFEIVKYPAVATQYEYLDEANQIVIQVDDQIEPGDAIAQNLTPVRKPGDALHPERYNEAALKRIRSTMTSRYWSAQFQLNPLPGDDAFFNPDDMVVYDALPQLNECYVIQSWDFAITEKKMSDFTVGTCTLQHHTDVLYVADMRRMKSGQSPKIVKAMLDLAQQWYPPNKNLIISVEDGQIWRTMEAIFKAECARRKFYPTIVVQQPLTDKKVRAAPLQANMEHRRMRFPSEDRAPWMAHMKHEMFRFPIAQHDDIVDSLSWMAHAAANKAPPQPPQVGAGKMKSWKDRLKGKGSNNGTGHMAA